MATYSSELVTVLKRYIDSMGEGRDRLTELLKNTSVDIRYSLLMNVRGGIFSRWTGLHSGACANDLETIKYMLDNFLCDQKCDVVKIQASNMRTALHFAAAYGYTSIINYLLNNLSQQQKYDLLKIQDENGNTALHRAAINKEVEAVPAIISAVSSPLLIQLLNIKNKEGQTVTDIRPELHDELPVLISQGIIFMRSVNNQTSNIDRLLH